MGYIDRLKSMNSEKCLPSPPQELQKAPSYSFCSTQGDRFQETTPASQSGIAAPPIPVQGCSTCIHVCRSGSCGNPVVAGLSDLPGVIRYSPDQGKTCRAWAPGQTGQRREIVLVPGESNLVDAALEPDLYRRIMAMAGIH